MGEGPITARVSDSQLLTDIEHRTFNFYWGAYETIATALRWQIVWSTSSSCSITGEQAFGSNCLAHWSRARLDHPQSGTRTSRCGRCGFFEQLPQGDPAVPATRAYRGFYYHFIDMGDRTTVAQLGLGNFQQLIPPGCNWAWPFCRKAGFDQEDEEGRKRKNSRTRSSVLLDSH